MSGKGTLGVNPKEAFIQQMVTGKNIFTPRENKRDELRFDCQHKAVKKVFDLRGVNVPRSYSETLEKGAPSHENKLIENHLMIEPSSPMNLRVFNAGPLRLLQRPPSLPERAFGRAWC